MNKYLEYILENINLTLKEGVGGLSINEIIIFIIIAFISIIARTLIAKFLVNKVEIFINKTLNKTDDLVFHSYIGPFKLLPIIGVFTYLNFLIDESKYFYQFISQINLTLTSVFIFWLFHGSIKIFSDFFLQLDKFFSRAITTWIINGMKYLVIVLGAVAVLEVWGVKIGPIVAGLGLLGVAVALGAQDLFKNLISGVLIILEKRFNISDVIELKDHSIGVVEYIGFRSTLIRQFDTSLISIPNYIFSELALINHSKRKYRRVNWIIGLTYDADIVKLKSVCSDTYEYISSSEEFVVNEEYKAIIRLEKFNDSSIDILINAFTNTSDWEQFLKIKENLAFKIKSIIEKNNCTFAFPSSSIYIEKK